MMAAFMPGARVEFLSDTTTVEIELQVTRLELPTDEPMPVSVDLVVDGELVGNAAVSGGTVLRLRTLEPPDFEVEQGGPSTVRFDGLPSEHKRIEVWLPHNAAVEVRVLRVDDGSQVARPERRRRWVHYGSSISQCVDAPRPTSVWPALVAPSRRCRPVEPRLRRGGAARPVRGARHPRSRRRPREPQGGHQRRQRRQHARARLRPAVHAFLDTIRDGHPTVPIVVVTPIICPAVEDRPGPTRHG